MESGFVARATAVAQAICWWGYASGDVTLNRAWIPPLYLTWD